MSCLKIKNIRANFFDLGQYTSFVSQIQNELFFEVLFSTHVQPFMAIFAALLPPGYIDYGLVLLQCGGIGIGGYVFIRCCPLDVRLPAALTYTFSLAPWFSALNDYHLEHLLFPLVIGFIGLLIQPMAHRWPALLGISIAVCLVKEPYALAASCLGGLAILRGHPRVGLVIVLISLATFFATTAYVIPAYTQGRELGELWSSSFGYLGKSPFEMLASAFAQPAAIAQHVLDWRKLLFIGVLVGPFIYVAWLAPAAMLPCLPAIAIMLVSANPDHAYLAHQYNVPVAATMMGAAAMALHRVNTSATRNQLLAFSAATSLVALVLFGPAPISRLFWSGHAHGYQWQAYVPTERSAEIRRLIALHIPRNRNIAVSVQNSIHVGIIAERPFVFPFPEGVTTPALVLPNISARLLGPTPSALAGRVFADFVIVDLKRPLSNRDKVCRWSATSVCTDDQFNERFHHALSAAKLGFDVIASYDSFVIYKRRK